MKQIIISVLDSDLYKLTMQQAVLELFPNAIVAYKFKNRGEQKFTPTFIRHLQNQINGMADISLFPDEYSWLQAHTPCFKPSYLEYLRNYRFDPAEVNVSLDRNNDLVIDIEGPWHSTILWEVPLMALISELYFKVIDIDWGEEIHIQKARAINKWSAMEQVGATFADFGTRRRRSKRIQDTVIETFVNVQKNLEGSCFVGTSNVHFAMKYGIRPIGTMAHEWFMGMSVLESLRNSNYYSLQNWVRVYNADLGIALTDTYGSDAFFRNFNLRLAKLYDGVRHDSGKACPFAQAVIAHYKSLGIDPMSKVIIFSDGLDIKEAIKIKKFCNGKIKCSFGIGTHLTNDFEGSKALNMVIKLWSCEGVPVVKLSDVPGKVMGDKDAVRVAQWTFNNIPLEWRQR